jgi:hypothetical protein
MTAFHARGNHIRCETLVGAGSVMRRRSSEARSRSRGGDQCRCRGFDRFRRFQKVLQIDLRSGASAPATPAAGLADNPRRRVPRRRRLSAPQ